MKIPTRKTLQQFLALGLAGSLSCTALAAPSRIVKAPSAETISDLAELAGGVLSELYDHYTSSQNESSSDTGSQELDTTPSSEYTIMLYLVGSNLESGAGLGSTEIAEIASSGLDFSRVNFLVYTGGSTSWSMGIPADTNNVYRIYEDQMESIGSTSEAMNTGDSENLADFLNYSYQNYPADHYALICWDHGGGPLFGFGNDENFDGDSLLLPELENALANSFAANTPLDWIGFDACLMSSIELAGSLHNYADYLIASQEIEPGTGWDYSFLSTLNSTYDPIEISKSLTDLYAQSLKANLRSFFIQSMITMGCMDLSKYPKVESAMDTLFARMNADLPNRFGDICRARRATKEYALSITNGRTDGYDLVDLKDLADQLASLYPSEAAALSDAVSEMMVYHSTDVPNTNGISMYFPWGNHVQWTYWGEPLSDLIYTSENVSSFMKNYSDTLVNYMSGADWSMSEPSVQGSALTLNLTNEQTADLASASFTLLEAAGDGSYTPVREDIPLRLNGNTLETNLDFLLVSAYDSSDSIEWPARIQEQNGTTTLYTSENAMVSNALTGDNPLFVNLSLQVDTTSGVILRTLYMADSDSSDKPTQGREELQLSLFGSIGCEYKYYTPTSDGSGNMLPFSEWPETGNRKDVFLPISTNLRFTVEPLTSTGKSYALQVVAEDIFGDCHASNLIQII